MIDASSNGESWINSPSRTKEFVRQLAPLAPAPPGFVTVPVAALETVLKAASVGADVGDVAGRDETAATIRAAIAEVGAHLPAATGVCEDGSDAG